jgi:transmembrane sensor
MASGPEDTRLLDSLLFRSLHLEATGAEEAKVLEWRHAAPENDAYYRELQRLLALTAEAYAGSPEGEPEPPDAAELLRLHAGRPVGVRRRRWWLAGGLAAAAVLLVLALPRLHVGPQQLLGLGVEEFATGARDAATVQLRDGTVVRLAPESRLRLTSTSGEREVTLDGRAYFAVAHMQGHPFTVRTGGGDIVVRGTRFEAESRGEELRLLVVEGRVAVRAPGQEAELGPGEMTRVVEGAVSAPVRVADPLHLIDWTGNFLVFQRTPIGEVAAEIQRHFNLPVRVVGDNLADQTVTAWFADSSAEDVLRVVCTVLAARCSIQEAQATIDLTQSGSLPRRARP